MKTYVYTNPEHTQIRVEDSETGEVLNVPVAEGNRHYAEIVAEGIEVAAYVAPPVDLPAYTAQKRWETEVGGTTWNGWQLFTDERSQGKYLAELQAIQLGVRQDGEFWKFPHGFEALTNAQIVEMATAARDHVKACFAKEAEVAVRIASGEVTTTAEIDAAFAALGGE